MHFKILRLLTSLCRVEVIPWSWPLADLFYKKNLLSVQCVVERVVMVIHDNTTVCLLHHKLKSLLPFQEPASLISLLGLFVRPLLQTSPASCCTQWRAQLPEEIESTNPFLVYRHAVGLPAQSVNSLPGICFPSLSQHLFPGCTGTIKLSPCLKSNTIWTWFTFRSRWFDTTRLSTSAGLKEIFLLCSYVLQEVTSIHF